MYVNVMLGNKKGMENETYLFYRANLYTFIVLHVAFPNIFSFEDLETVHVAIFIFALFVVDCFIYMAFEKEKIYKAKRNGTKREKRSFWMMTYCLSLVLTAAFFSEHIPLERVNIGFGAFVFAYYFYALSSLYERKARRRGKSACRRRERTRA